MKNNNVDNNLLDFINIYILDLLDLLEHIKKDIDRTDIYIYIEDIFDIIAKFGGVDNKFEKLSGVCKKMLVCYWLHRCDDDIFLKYMKYYYLSCGEPELSPFLKS
jgi:hypothetical protein